MERSRYDSPISNSEATNGFRFAPNIHDQQQQQPPDYTSKNVQEALRHLASIELISLCNEARVERCRASRDLRSCGRLVESVLSSCGHASLCAECSQCCESCPICRTVLPKNGNILQLRLYYECLEAGLISKASDDRFQEDTDEAHMTANVERLYSLFDVAMENNLCCLICHYVTDVCMDENAVSSDPVIAFLLDEVVVKNWCKRTFKNIIEEVRGIYNLETDQMTAKMDALLKTLAKLVGLSNVLEVLDLSFKGTHSAKLEDLHHLQESILKTKQHMELMMWCIRHKFLENVKSRHSNIGCWKALVRDRKEAAATRAWPEAVVSSGEFMEPDNSSLFIEDALVNIGIDDGYSQGSAFGLDVKSLQKDRGSSYFRSEIEGFGLCYPFENIRTAIDTLFLFGTSDMVVAKRAIFLYYLFDRHWTIADEEWRHVVDDFAATFSITRQSLLESLTFYLLDDPSGEALQEACQLLPEISGPESHPKIAKVLLERQNPDLALMFLRWSGHDCGAEMSLTEAVTAVRVRVECGLLAEAFMYQRMLYMRIKEKQTKHKYPLDAPDSVEGNSRTWTEWMFVLVTEMCCLCFRRNLIDHIIELPWNQDEERHLHKCLLDFAKADPVTTAGSLVVVYYLQRHQYVDAYHIHRKLQVLEDEYLSTHHINEEDFSRWKSSFKFREGLVNKSLDLLPEVERQQLKDGTLTEVMSLCGNDKDVCPREAEISGEEQIASVPSASSPLQSSLILQMGHDSPFRPTQDVHLRDSQLKFGNLASPAPALPHGDFFMSERPSKSSLSDVRNFVLDDMSTPESHYTRTSAVKDVFKTAARSFQNGLPKTNVDGFVPQAEQNGLFGQLPKVSPPNSRRVMAKPTKTPGSTRCLLDETPEERYKTATGKRLSPGDPDRPWNMVSSDDAMDISWSRETNGPAPEFSIGGAQRWRSDETCEEEEQPSPERLSILSSRPPIRRGARRGRLLRR